MSENIQSISQGTYTIGSTSATNFIAGPGISIDSPSAGTVRIGNDETVLWSGTGTSAITASEPFTNFDHIDLWIQHGQYGPARSVSLDMNAFTGTTGYFGIERPRGTSNLNVAFMRIEVNKPNKTLTCTNSKCIEFGSYTSTATSYSVSLNSDEDRKSIIKVVGINRISGNA